MGMKTERERQAVMGNTTFFYLCNDGEIFHATARTEAGAFRVLNAERPGMLAIYLGSQSEPCGHL